MDVLLLAAAQTLARKGAYQHVNISGSLPASTYRTDLSITGRGHLLYIALNGTNPSTNRFRITVDGGPANLIGQVTFTGYPYNNSGASGRIFAFDIPFNTSLVVESYNSDTISRTVETEVAYILS